MIAMPAALPPAPRVVCLSPSPSPRLGSSRVGAVGRGSAAAHPLSVFGVFISPFRFRFRGKKSEENQS